MVTLVKQEENLTNPHSFFVSKEHYLACIAAWKQSIAEGFHERKTYIDNNGGTCKYRSQLTVAHHLVYNVLRKKDLHKSFAPITNPSKLMNDHRGPYSAFYSAWSQLGWAIKWRPDIIKAPFKGTVNDKMLEELYNSLKDVKL